MTMYVGNYRITFNKKSLEYIVFNDMSNEIEYSSKEFIKCYTFATKHS